MARGRGHGRRRRGHGGEAEGGDERWLLTYADMITLLMALFMVLFSISSVNISKFQTLQQALHAAFSGDILPGGKSIAQPGATANSSHAPSAADVQAIVPLTAQPASTLQSTASAATQQASEFARIKAKLDAYSKQHGFSKNVKSSIDRRGLVIRVLTDKLLFASGRASLESGATPLLGEIAQLLDVEQLSPVAVEGNTDDVPIHSSVFPSNWELSTARASTVVRFLISQGVGAPRLSAAGYADQHPIAANTDPSGRARNRRVEIVLQRLPGPSTTFSTNPTG
ncbi:MAG TPA: flagellar motor protein MotB [Solirubrobacteraceae bacterium]|nr:flagellar motor protein MotB [Solirubrobacteraceae bacterium]